MDPGIEEQQHEEEYARDGNSGQEAEQKELVAGRSYRRVVGVGLVDDPGIVVGHGLGQCVFLAFVQKEDIQAFLYLLLTLYGQHLTLRGRDGGYPHPCPFFAARGIIQTDIEADDHIVHRADYRLFHGHERVVELLHHRMHLAAIVDELVAAELQGVVLTDLRLYVHVADTGIRRDQVEFLGRIGQIVLNILCKFQLGLKFEHVGTVPLGLLHIHAGRRGNVQYLVVFLEHFQIGLDGSEFAFDDDQTFIDEVGRIDRHLVLVVDRVFVVDGDEHVQHIRRPDRRLVFQGEPQDGGLFLFLTYAEVGPVVGDYRLERTFRHIYLAPFP